MEVNKFTWPVTFVCGIKDAIDPEPDFQRPPVWSRAQKQLLIDSILRGYDVPKMYWRRMGKDKYDVVDGQQRLRAIWEFQRGDYPLAADADALDGHEVRSVRYGDLPLPLRLRFDIYNLDIMVLSDADEDEVREMFLRLQNGTSLKAQEKRNAMPGKMRDWVRTLARHPFFENCGFKDSRFAFDHVAAQITLTELQGQPANVKNADLNRMYARHADFDPASAKAKKIRRALDYLCRAFPDKTPELERYSVISLYTLVSYLLEQYVIQDRQDDLRTWFLEFETYRRGQRQLPEDECDPEIVSYYERVSHSTDAEDSIRWRHEFLLRRLLERHPDLALRDDQRIFTHEQRLAIYRRDQGICRVRLRCQGTKCEWDKWHADHVRSWSSGGRSTVENGQVACPACNLAKGGASTACQSGPGG